jgi:hypothetical protein
MRDIYHCPPDVLDEQDYWRGLTYIELLKVEKKVERMNLKKTHSGGAADSD